MPDALQSGFQSIVTEAGRESVVSEAGSPPLLYRTALWTGTYWRDVGYGPITVVPLSQVKAFSPLGTDLYIGGYIGDINDGQDTIGGMAINPKPGTVARWGQLGGGMTGQVKALLEHDGYIVACGDFTVADLSAPGDTDVAKWDGDWYEVYQSNHAYTAGASYNGDIHLAYSKGAANAVGNVIKVIDTTTAVTLTGQDIGAPSGHLLALLEGDDTGGYWALGQSNGLLYGGGEFVYLETEGGDPWVWSANNIWAFDSTVPEFILLDDGTDDGVNAAVFAIEEYSSGVIIVGGDFTTAGGVNANRVAKWDHSTSTWSALGDGFNGPVYALTYSGGYLYAGGAFTASGATTVNHIAQWNVSAWAPVGDGLNGDVRALRGVPGGPVYAGGDFTDVA